MHFMTSLEMVSYMKEITKVTTKFFFTTHEHRFH